MSDLTTHEVLVAARNLMDRHGWRRGGAYPGGPYCLLGAVSQAVHGREDKWVAPTDGPSQAARTELAKVTYVSPWVWNDTQCKTKEQALSKFDEAIAATAPPPADPVGPGPSGCVPDNVEGSGRSPSEDEQHVVLGCLGGEG